MSLGRDPRGRRGATPEPETATQKSWKGLNLTDTRLTIDDDELAFLENGMWLGRGVVSVPLYNGSPGAALAVGTIVKESFGSSLTYGANTIPHPVAIVVFEDGSAVMRDLYLDQNLDVQVAPAGTFSTSPKGTAITIWQDGPILIQDDKAGYLSWNGVSLTVIDASKIGHSLAVFEGHVWLLTAARTISFTAPNSFSDFTAGNGAGSFKITDDAFVGAISDLHSTVEQLWLLGASSIDALGNVATTGGVTTFAVTNAIATLGTTFGRSVIGYFRALTFATGYSFHSLLGVTPQKLSAKLDRLFAALAPAITFGPRPGVVQLNGQLVLVFLYQYTDPATAVARTELVCFVEGKFFLATTPDLGGTRVLDMVQVTVGTTPELYGVDALGRLYRLFARPSDLVTGTMTIVSKLYDLGGPTEGHQAIRVGLDLSAPKTTQIAPVSVTLDTEGKSLALPLASEKFLPVANDPLGTRYALYRRDAPVIGERIGYTLKVPCAYGVALEASYLEYAPTGSWNVVDPAAVVWDFTGAGGVPFKFTGAAAVAFDWLS